MSEVAVSQAQQDAAFNAARAKDFEVILEGRDMLLLDLDTQGAWDLLPQRIRLLQGVFPHMRIHKWWYSKSGHPNRHVVINMGPGPVDWGWTARSALRATLGSDLVREVHILEGFYRGVDHPVALFQPANAEVVRP